MIRLIATDMDGTLLDSKKQLPPDFDVVMRKLYERDILFAVASGRSYATLKKQFEDYLDDIVFICDNGANVVYQQESVSVSLLAWELVEEIVEQVRRGGGKMLLCGKHGTYHEYFGSTEAEDEIVSYYVNQVIVDNVLDVKDEIFKIAVFDEQNMEQTLYPAFKKCFRDRLNYQMSGEHWMDVMNADVNKGMALKQIRKTLGISYEETMAFGDYMNDYELLKEAKESYAMGNAHEGIKKIAAHITGTNDEQGVMNVIKHVVLGME